MLRILEAASTAIAVGAAQLTASGDAALFKAWFVRNATIVIALVDRVAEGSTPHATLFERMARGNLNQEVSDTAKNLTAGLPAVFDWFWNGAQKGFK
jgi:hypothetical protein